MRGLFLSLLAVLIPVGLAAAAELPEFNADAWVADIHGRLGRDAGGNIVSIDLTSAWVSDPDLEQLARMPHLRTINLSYTWATDLGMEHLKSLENVEELILHYTEEITDGGVAHVKHWQKLRHLDVRGTKVTSRVFEHVGRIKTLEFLDVGFSRVTDDGFENLADLTELKSLGFGGNKMSGVALPLLQMLPALAHLDLGGLQRTDSGSWGLALSDFNLESIEALTALESLNLQDAKLTDMGLKRLAALRNLDSLDLSRTPITGRGAQALTTLPKLKRLKLWQCEQVGDDLAVHLPAFKQVEVLDLAETSVTAEVLESASRMPSLKQLFVGGTKIALEAVEGFRAEHPAIHVTWWAAPADPEKEEPDKK
jgi:Leucine-rich repeat (LRR) protein